MDFLERAALTKDDNFLLMVQGAIVKSALAILNDRPANTPEAIEAHRRRCTLAREVLLEPERLAKAMAIGVVSNPAIEAKSTDNDVEFTVNSIWNAYAGVVLPPA